MEKLTDIHGKLLEGCVWDEKKNCLYFVDIESFRIYRYELENKALSCKEMDTYVSCIVLNEDGT